MADVISNNGVDYEVVDPKVYVRGLRCESAPEVLAHKVTPVFAQMARQYDETSVHAGDGTHEASEVAGVNQVMLTKLNPDGTFALDADGNKNSWFCDYDVFVEKYGEQDAVLLCDGMIANPLPPKELLRFVQIDRDIATMQPWGKDGALVPQCIREGGWLNITDMNGVYGISSQDFDVTYTVDADVEPEYQAHGVVLDCGVDPYFDERGAAYMMVDVGCKKPMTLCFEIDDKHAPGFTDPDICPHVGEGVILDGLKMCDDGTFEPSFVQINGRGRIYEDSDIIKDVSGVTQYDEDRAKEEAEHLAVNFPRVGRSGMLHTAQQYDLPVDLEDQLGSRTTREERAECFQARQAREAQAAMSDLDVSVSDIKAHSASATRDVEHPTDF